MQADVHLHACSFARMHAHTCTHTHAITYSHNATFTLMHTHIHTHFSFNNDNSCSLRNGHEISRCSNYNLKPLNIFNDTVLSDGDGSAGKWIGKGRIENDGECTSNVVKATCITFMPEREGYINVKNVMSVTDYIYLFLYYST